MRYTVTEGTRKRKAISHLAVIDVLRGTRSGGERESARIVTPQRKTRRRRRVRKIVIPKGSASRLDAGRHAEAAGDGRANAGDVH